MANHKMPRNVPSFLFFDCALHLISVVYVLIKELEGRKQLIEIFLPVEHCWLLPLEVLGKT